MFLVRASSHIIPSFMLVECVKAIMHELHSIDSGFVGRKGHFSYSYASIQLIYFFWYFIYAMFNKLSALYLLSCNLFVTSDAGSANSFLVGPMTHRWKFVPLLSTLELWVLVPASCGSIVIMNQHSACTCSSLYHPIIVNSPLLFMYSRPFLINYCISNKVLVISKLSLVISDNVSVK